MPFTAGGPITEAKAELFLLRDPRTTELPGVARQLLSRDLRQGQVLLAALRDVDEDADDAVALGVAGRASA